MRALVTGATGFIGRHLVERLRGAGDDVRALVRQASLDDPAKAARLRQAGVRIVAGDMNDAAAVARAVDGVDVVYHLALEYHPLRSFASFTPINLAGTRRLLEASGDAGVRRFVQASSVAVYGYVHPRAAWPLDEKAPLCGITKYDRTKIGLEQLVRAVSRERRLEPVVLRLPCVYGCHPRYERLVAHILRFPIRALRSRWLPDPLVEWAGVSHWLHVRDAARAALLAGRARRVGPGTFNIAGDEAVTRAELVRLVHDAAGDGAWVGPLQARAAPVDEPQTPIYDTSLAKALLGFRPEVSFRTGIGEIVAGLTRRRPYAPA